MNGDLLVLAVLSAAAAAALLCPPGSATRLHGRRGVGAPSGWLRGRPNARSLHARSVIGLGVGGVALWLLPAGALGLLVATGLGFGAFLAAGQFEGPDARRRGELIARDLPETLDLLAACLDAGLPLRAAISTVAGAVSGPLAEELGRVSAQITVGVPEAKAWASLHGHLQLANLAREAARGVETGAAMGPGMRRLADEARRDWRALCQTRARAVGVKTVLPLGLCYLPSFFLVGVVPVVAGAFLAVA